MKVLLVEDAKVAQMVIESMLKTFPYDIAVADDGEQAIKILTETKYDLVFMDLGLPGMNGFEATKKIRMINGYEKLPIIALTAHCEDDYRKHALEIGMDDFVEKPLTIDKAQAVFERFLFLR